MSVPFFDITRQNRALEKELNAAIIEVASSGRYILGKTVEEFEKHLAQYCGCKFAIGVASGTDALHLSLKAAGVGPGDEVITSPFTFVATAEAIAYCGAKPVFCDIQPKTFNLDPTRIESKLSKKTKAILPVHLYGLPCDMGRIMEIARKNQLSVVEDCAQAIGAEFDGKKAGAIGDAGSFSFFPTKNLGCFGDGGAITTNSDKIREDLLALRNHGSRKTYHYDMIGHNSRLDALQAAILSVKMPSLDVFFDKRANNAKIYDEQLSDLKEISLPSTSPNAKHVFNQYTIRIQKGRDELFGYLKDKNIGAMVYYPLSLHLQTAFASLGHKPGDFPQSEAAQNEVLSLPIFPELTEAEIKEACSTIRNFFKK